MEPGAQEVRPSPAQICRRDDEIDEQLEERAADGVVTVDDEQDVVDPVGGRWDPTGPVSSSAAS